MPVDEETLKKYHEATGKEGLKLALSLGHNREGDIVLRTPFGRCCNLAGDGLCKLHRDGKLEYMPKVCRLFPRNTASYGEYELGMLDLSCIEASRLLIESNGRQKYVTAPEDMPIYWKLDDVYPDFVEDLRIDLESILDYLWKEADENATILRLREKMKGIFIHAYGMHQRLVRDDLEGARGIPFEPAFECEEEKTPEILSRCIELKESAFFPMTFINELIYGNIPEEYLRRYHKLIYRLTKQYKKLFGGISESEADAFYDKKVRKVLEKNSRLENMLFQYFSYKLQMNYINAAVDYYVLEPVILSILNVQFLMLFIIVFVEEKENGCIDKRELALLMSENERLISHNKVFNADVMNKFRMELY